MKYTELKGIIPPIVTPMNDDAEQSVNYLSPEGWEVMKEVLTEDAKNGLH